MAVNSYLNDYVEGKRFYFSFGSFPTERVLYLGLKSRFNFQACATPWFFLFSNLFVQLYNTWKTYSLAANSTWFKSVRVVSFPGTCVIKVLTKGFAAHYDFHLNIAIGANSE